MRKQNLKRFLRNPIKFTKLSYSIERDMMGSVFVKTHRTNILPLRWLANYIFHPISMVFFRIGMKANYQIYESGEGYTLLDELKERFGYRVYRVLDRPYSRWGTVFEIDTNGLDINFSDSDWDDYNEYGSPYWDYFWHTDEETGDGWRLINDTR